MLPNMDVWGEVYNHSAVTLLRYTVYPARLKSIKDVHVDVYTVYMYIILYIHVYIYYNYTHRFICT